MGGPTGRRWSESIPTRWGRVKEEDRELEILGMAAVSVRDRRCPRVRSDFRNVRLGRRASGRSLGGSSDGARARMGRDCFETHGRNAGAGTESDCRCNHHPVVRHRRRDAADHALGLPPRFQLSRLLFRLRRCSLSSGERSHSRRDSHRPQSTLAVSALVALRDSTPPHPAPESLLTRIRSRESCSGCCSSQFEIWSALV